MHRCVVYTCAVHTGVPFDVCTGVEEVVSRETMSLMMQVCRVYRCDVCVQVCCVYRCVVYRCAVCTGVPFLQLAMCTGVPCVQVCRVYRCAFYTACHVYRCAMVTGVSWLQVCYVYNQKGIQPKRN